MYLADICMYLAAICIDIFSGYIENNTWERGNTIFISSVEHEVFPSTHVFFCLLYKQNSVKNNKTSVAVRFTTNDIFTRKNIVFFTCV